MLELYQAEGCPYCKKVRMALTHLGISYMTHNPRRASGEVRNEQAYADLLELGGPDQIPFLVDPDRNVTSYESDDIISYLETHYGDRPRSTAPGPIAR